LINQAIGYGCLNYPRTAESFIWGLGMGAASYATLAVAMWFAKRARAASGLLLASATLGFAFATFKALILIIGYGLNHTFEFSWTNVEKMLVINIATLVGLIAINHLALRIATARSRSANCYAHVWRERIISQ
jgi:MFS family permease